jgi:hypothetical protein
MGAIWRMCFVASGDTLEFTRKEVTSSWKRPTHHIAIPAHSPLRVGTLSSILRAVSAHKQVSREAILDTL